MKKLLIVLLVVALAAFLLVGCIPVTPGEGEREGEGEGKVIVALAQSPVDLGSAGNFAILAKSGITNVPTSAIVGDIGVSPITGASITGLDDCSQVNGTIYTVDAAGPACRVVAPFLLTTAVLDMEAAYTNAAGRAADVTELGSGNIGGMTLAPGVYKWGTGVTIPTDVTLSGGKNAVWIFQIAGTLDISSATSVILRGGAQAKNIFWAVADVVALGTTSEFNGNILAKTNITMTNGATLNGRALAQTAVTLIANTITVPGGPVAPPPPTVEEGRMTGGGSVVIGTETAKRYTHGFELQGKLGAGPNNFQYNDHSLNGNFKLESVTSVSLSDDPAINPNPPGASFDTLELSGSGRWNGVSGYIIVLKVTDAGEPGRNDSLSVIITNPAGDVVVSQVSGKLSSGNHQAH